MIDTKWTYVWIVSVKKKKISTPLKIFLNEIKVNRGKRGGSYSSITGKGLNSVMVAAREIGFFG